MRYYIIAGERSGDLHASNLIKSIKSKDTNAAFRGFGGDYMKGAGADLYVDYNEMAFMGLAQILANLNKISKYIRMCKEDILQYKPDVVILVDYGGFNRRIAKFCRINKIKVFYYIPPKVWAWYQQRAVELKKNVDCMFVILPFEKDFFRKFGWEVDYVGNPVLDAVKAHQNDPGFLSKNNFSEADTRVALLPGSRKQELKTIVPLMAGVAKRFPNYQFVVATVSNLDKSLYGDLADFPNVKFVYEDTYNLLLNSSAAIVTSGTATLETGLFRVPQIVVYKTSALSYWPAKFVIKVAFISLVNLIAGREVIKEFIQDKATVANVSDELKKILQDVDHRNKILQGYDEVIKILDTGSASENAARLMVSYLQNNQVNKKY
jgi:lipid-A-disaccharide synthase